MSFNSVNDKMDEAQQDASEDNYILATVISNNDPMGLNRIQVSAPGLFDPEQGEQPWVGSHPYSPFGQGPNYGVYGSPYVGSMVKVKAQDGDVNQAQYEASAYVKQFANPKFASPMTYGYRDPKGNELFVNMETGEWTWTHNSGFKQSWDGSGKMTITAPAGIEETITGDFTLNVEGNINIHATGNITASADGIVTVTGSTINLN